MNNLSIACTILTKLFCPVIRLVPIISLQSLKAFYSLYNCQNSLLSCDSFGSNHFASIALLSITFSFLTFTFHSLPINRFLVKILTNNRLNMIINGIKESKGEARRRRRRKTKPLATRRASISQVEDNEVGRGQREHNVIRS